MILNKSIKDFVQNEKIKLWTWIKNDFDKPPVLAVIQVGNNEASNRYIKNKKKDCEEVGIKFEWYCFDENITTADLIFEIENLNNTVDGLIVQMPLPEYIDTEVIKTAINPEVDVDGFHPMSLFSPCTPLGIIDYLMFGCRYVFEGKHIVVIGRSDIVGKPLAEMLTDLNATVTLCHSKTKNLDKHIEAADMIICAVGKANFLDCRYLDKPVIDVGINFDENGKLVGDCYNTEGRDVTPVPGGVGLLTRLVLLENVVHAANLHKSSREAR